MVVISFLFIGPESLCICPDLFSPVCCNSRHQYSNECQAKCAGYDVIGECQTGACKIKCQQDKDCDQENYGQYRCQSDPQTWNYDKVCMDLDGICSDQNCDNGYQCISDGNLIGLCIKYQT